MDDHIFEIEASSDQITQIAQAGYLDRWGVKHGLMLIGHLPNQRAWQTFLDRMLLALGAAFGLSGVVFFFAYNWAELTDFAKFGLIQAGIFTCLGLTHYRGVDTLSGKASLIGAAVLVGAHLAVQGQVYQTGADSYLLFLFWAILITAWAIIGQSGLLWLIWLLLLNLSLGLYWDQVVDATTVDETMIFHYLFALNGLALCLCEIGYAFNLTWLQGRWLPKLIALATAIFAVIPTLMFIFDGRTVSEMSRAIAVSPIIFIIFVTFVIWLYWRHLPDLMILTIATFSIITVISSAIAELVADFDVFGMLIVGLAIIGQAALAVNGLRYIDKSWEEAHHDA